MNHSAAGQTLVETMVAVFIMVMGITAALGLANYSLNASTSISKQIIGIGLAREGIEAVKNMRDTNWLNGQLDTNCHNFTSSFPGQCYRNWLNPANGYNISVSGTQSYYLGFNAAAPTGSPNGFWLLTTTASGNPWGLNNSPTLANGLYTPSASTASDSGYFRRITITADTSAPFDTRTGGVFDWPRLLVTSQVWWRDKNCPNSTTWPGTSRCSVQLQTYLTNWKNY